MDKTMDSAVRKRALGGSKNPSNLDDRGAQLIPCHEKTGTATETRVRLSEPIEIYIPGDPISWARPIPTGRGSITPEKQRCHKATLQLYFRRAYGNRPAIPLGAPVGVEIQFIYASKVKKQHGQFKSTRPDLDNLAKQILDALQGSHAPLILMDDGQVVSLSLSKVYGAEAGTRVKVWEMPA